MSPLLDQWLALFDNARPIGETGWYQASCPMSGHSHNDRKPSLNIGLSSSGNKVILKCFAGHDAVDIAACMGKKVDDLYENKRVFDDPPPTLADLAFDKRLPRRFLEEKFGLSDAGKGKGVLIPYYDESNKHLFDRRRKALAAKDGTFQPSKTPLQLYGMWLLPEHRTAGSVLVFVEGESDVWTLHLHGLPGVGVPGADAHRAVLKEHLEGFQTLYVWQEPGDSGKKFVVGFARKLRELGYEGMAKVLSGGPVKDPNALHQRGPDEFKEAFAKIVTESKPLNETAAELEKGLESAVVGEGKEHESNGKAKGGRRRVVHVPAVAEKIAKETAGLPRAAPGYYGLTDLGNAERLVYRHGADIRYCHTRNRWMVWDGARWTDDASGEVSRRMVDTVRSIYTEARECEDRELRDAIGDHARKSENNHQVRAAMELAQSLPGVSIHPADMDADPWRLNLLNGTLDLQTGKLLSHRREDYQSKRTEIIFDEAACCPTWLAFLHKIMEGSKDLIDFLQLAVGYSLTGSVREKCFFFLHGSGDNGKTTFIETLNSLLGDYFKKTTADTVLVKKYGPGIPNDLARLPGIRFVNTPEIAENCLLDEARIKDMTGKDTISARFLHAEWFDFKPVFKLWMYGNHKPVIHGADDGIWRRIRLIPFDVTIPKQEQDQELAAKLCAELPGILNWASTGCLRWQREGLPAPAGVREASDDYRQEMDVVGAFLGDCCRVDQSDGGLKVAPKELYEAYCEWAKGNSDDPIGSRLFAGKMKTKGFKQKKGTRGARTWQKVGLIVPLGDSNHESNGHTETLNGKGLEAFDR